MNNFSLPAIQQWMQSVLQHPQGVMSGDNTQRGRTEFDIADVITPSSRQSAVDRLAIYTRAYWARLLDCLATQFPAVKAAAGDEAFAGFAAGYLQANPSRSTSLNNLGQGFSGYLAATRPPRDAESSSPDYADFLIELAALEWCYSLVFDALGPETVESLSHEAVLALGPEGFSRSRLQFHDTVRLMTLRFPCHEFASAVRQSREPAIPAAAVTHLVVHRRDFKVQRFTVPAWQFRLLSSLLTGSDISQALSAVVACKDCPAELDEAIRRCFGIWTKEHLFRGMLSSR